MYEMVCVARRETSRGSALYFAALSKTVRINSPSGTVFGIWIAMFMPFLGCTWQLQQVPGHQPVGNDIRSLHGSRSIIMANSFKMKHLSHQFEGERRWMKVDDLELKDLLELDPEGALFPVDDRRNRPPAPPWCHARRFNPTTDLPACRFR